MIDCPIKLKGFPPLAPRIASDSKSGSRQSSGECPNHVNARWLSADNVFVPLEDLPHVSSFSTMWMRFRLESSQEFIWSSEASVAQLVVMALVRDVVSLLVACRPCHNSIFVSDGSS